MSTVELTRNVSETDNTDNLLKRKISRVTSFRKRNKTKIYHSDEEEEMDGEKIAYLRDTNRGETLKKKYRSNGLIVDDELYDCSNKVQREFIKNGYIYQTKPRKVHAGNSLKQIFGTICLCQFFLLILFGGGILGTAIYDKETVNGIIAVKDDCQLIDYKVEGSCCIKRDKGCEEYGSFIRYYAKVSDCGNVTLLHNWTDRQCLSINEIEGFPRNETCYRRCNSYGKDFWITPPSEIEKDAENRMLTGFCAVLVAVFLALPCTYLGINMKKCFVLTSIYQYLFGTMEKAVGYDPRYECDDILAGSFLGLENSGSNSV